MSLEIKGTDDSIMAQATDFAFEFNVTVYDAFFLALSQIEKAPFITADYRFIDRISDLHNILKLSDI